MGHGDVHLRHHIPGLVLTHTKEENVMFAKYFVPFFHGALTACCLWLGATSNYVAKPNTFDCSPWYVGAVFLGLAALAIMVISIIKEIGKGTWE